MKYLCVRVLCMIWSCLVSLLAGMDQPARQRYRPRFMATSVPVRQLTMEGNLAAFVRASQQQSQVVSEQQEDELMPQVSQSPALESDSAGRGDAQSADSTGSVVSMPAGSIVIDPAVVPAQVSGYYFDSREIFVAPTPTELQPTPVFRQIKRVRVWRKYPQDDLVLLLKREFGRRYVGDDSDSDESDSGRNVVC